MCKGQDLFHNSLFQIFQRGSNWFSYLYSTFKTSVCQKSLNPVWNSDWFRFDVDDCDLQDEPLQIRIMDYDTYSANDAIGKVYIDLNPLLLKADSNRVSTDGQKQIMLSGWLPVCDRVICLPLNTFWKIPLLTDIRYDAWCSRRSPSSSKSGTFLWSQQISVIVKHKSFWY